MNVSRRDFLAGLGATGAAFALPGCKCPFCCGLNGKIAVQLYSIHQLLGGVKDRKTGAILKPGIGLEKGLEAVAKIGYKAVEFAGYYGFDGKQLKKMLDDNGLVACGTHVGKDAFSPANIKATCEFNLAYGNSFICCPGGGNFPGKDEPLDDFLKKLVDYYNVAADTAATYGCKIGLHNHTREFQLKMKDGTLYWDYFFSHTNHNVCMEQDIGWTTCAGFDPSEQWKKYPHRSLTLHAKENGMGKGVTKFDGILGQPGLPGAVPVDWDKAIAGAEADGLQWWVVECERHFDSLEAITPSYAFLKAKGLN